MSCCLLGQVLLLLQPNSGLSAGGTSGVGPVGAHNYDLFIPLSSEGHPGSSLHWVCAVCNDPSCPFIGDYQTDFSLRVPRVLAFWVFNAGGVPLRDAILA